MAVDKHTQPLRATEEKLEKLRIMCSELSITSKEFKQKVRPVLAKIRSDEKTRIFPLKMATTAVAVLVVSFVINSSTIQEFIMVQSRLALIKVRPYWDWESSPYRLCLMGNPHYDSKEKAFNEENCEACAGLKGIERISSLSQSDALNLYLTKDIPVVVSDTASSWTRIDSVLDLLEVMRSSVTSAGMLCELRTNLKWHNDISLLFKKMADARIKKWFAQWENCDKIASKAIRRFYKRPYFLPSTVENTNNNWVIVSSEYTGNIYKKVPASADVTWMGQVYGTSALKVTPIPECSAFCDELSIVLKAGEIVMLPDFLWELSYLSGNDSENVAIGVSGLVEI